MRTAAPKQELLFKIQIPNHWATVWSRWTNDHKKRHIYINPTGTSTSSYGLRLLERGGRKLRNTVLRLSTTRSGDITISKIHIKALLATKSTRPISTLSKSHEPHGRLADRPFTRWKLSYLIARIWKTRRLSKPTKKSSQNRQLKEWLYCFPNDEETTKLWRKN